jgi:hypothetical protein
MGASVRRFPAAVCTVCNSAGLLLQELSALVDDRHLDEPPAGARYFVADPSKARLPEM